MYMRFGYELIIALVDCFFLGSIGATAVDEVNGFLYWSDGSMIKRSTLTGGHITVIRDVGKL